MLVCEANSRYRLRRLLHRPRRHLLPPPPPPPEKIILRGVHFDFDKANIRPQDAAVLDEAAETLKSHPNVTVNVNGYCDAIEAVRIQPAALRERRPPTPL